MQVLEDSELPNSLSFKRAEYFEKLGKWVQTAYCQQYALSTFAFHSAILNHMAGNNTQIATSHAHITHRVIGIECKLPPVWKRLLAEFIDFLSLFVIKIMTTYIIIDYFHLIDWTKYDLDSLLQITKEMEYKRFMELTSELMFMELLHRVIVCSFETFWLSGSLTGTLGGATPGKFVLNLRVVSCDRVTTVRSDPDLVVLVMPGSNLGFVRSLFRAIVKNFVLTAFVPLTFTFFYFQYNRTGYDILTHSIVIQEPLRLRVAGRR